MRLREDLFCVEDFWLYPRVVDGEALPLASLVNVDANPIQERCALMTQSSPQGPTSWYHPTGLGFNVSTWWWAGDGSIQTLSSAGLVSALDLIYSDRERVVAHCLNLHFPADLEHLFTCLFTICLSLNLSHGSCLSHSSDNASSLTQWATRELPGPIF